MSLATDNITAPLFPSPRTGKSNHENHFKPSLVSNATSLVSSPSPAPKPFDLSICSFEFEKCLGTGAKYVFVISKTVLPKLVENSGLQNNIFPL